MTHSKLWIDMINPSDVQFFNSLLKDLYEYEIISTTRNRAETVDLADYFKINNTVVGRDYTNPAKKILGMIFRTLDLSLITPRFDCSLSFENGMSVFVSKLRRKKSIMYCDNDLKFIQKKSSIQDFETKLKSLADFTIVPKVCYDNFKNYYDESKLLAFDGIKEDIYIADYIPNSSFLDTLPFENFIVVRPEALASIYVKDKESIVPELLNAFTKENINVVYIPRDEGDARYAEGTNVFIPERAFNGLDLCYYADAILTGSGTLAREAACMGTTSISFFPSSILLSPDQYLVDEGRIFHSRNVENIVDYVISRKNNQPVDLSKSKKAKDSVVSMTKEILEGDQ